MIKTCETCDKEIPRGAMSLENKKYQRKRFCSNECHYTSMKRAFEYKCTSCGEKVIRKKEGITTNVFCNDICKGRNLGKVSRVFKATDKSCIVICMQCNKEQTVPSSKKDRKFCTQSCRAEYNISKMRGESRKHKIISCNNCGTEFQKPLYKITNLNFCIKDCMYEYYRKEDIFKGSNSGTWNGGKKSYYGENWLSQRRESRKRDNYSCQRCGITEKDYGQEMSVHHIIPFVMFKDYLEANKLDNLICVCEPCHRKIHSGDNHPSKFFKTNSVGDIV